MTPSIGPPHYSFHQAFSDRFYGGLSHLEVTLPPSAADALWTASRVGLVAFAIVLVVRFASVRRNAALVLVLGSCVAALLLALHLVAYRAMLSSPGDPVIAGRYILPLVGLFGVAIGLVAAALPRPLSGAFAGAVVATGVGLQLASAGLLLERFYA
jgi:hypothetical protein